MEETESKMETMIEKITKLLAKAENTTNAEEAEAFSAKATKLMIKWSIDEAVIQARRSDGGKPDEIITKRIAVRTTFWKAHRELGFAVGYGFGFKLLQANHSSEKGANGSFTWIGFESDISKAELLYTSLLIQCQRALTSFTAEWKQTYYYLPKHEEWKSRRAFIMGFATEIQGRLQTQRRAAEKEAKAADVAAGPVPVGTPSVELVLVSKQEKLRDYYDQRYGKLRSGRATSVGMGVGGYNSGRVAGAAANLGGTGITGSRGSIGKGS